MQNTPKLGTNPSILTPSLAKFVKLIFNRANEKDQQEICMAILRSLPIAVAGGSQEKLIVSLNLKTPNQYWRVRKYLFDIGMLKKESREIFVYEKNAQRKYIVLNRDFLRFLRLTIESFSKMPTSTT
jgi:hypothetical protein